MSLREQLKELNLGMNRKVVPHYEKAIVNGLVEDRSGAILGLGSTYRRLGSSW